MGDTHLTDYAMQMGDINRTDHVIQMGNKLMDHFIQMGNRSNRNRKKFIQIGAALYLSVNNVGYVIYHQGNYIIVITH